jgi:hypothetical protein
MKAEYEISDYEFILSSIGNAYFSNVSFDELWSCIAISNNREELDAAIDATIKIRELTENKNEWLYENNQGDTI